MNKFDCKILAFFTVIALIFGAITPSFAVSKDLFYQNNNSFFGDKVLICTSSGLEWVSYSDLEKQNKIPQKPHKAFKCSLCSNFAAHNLSVGEFIYDFELHFKELSYFLNLKTNFAQNYSLSQNQTRAPPSLFV